MGIDALRAAVEEDARARVAGVLEEARACAERLRDEAANMLTARRQRALREEETALRLEASARIAAAREAARKRVLDAREAMLDRVFALARDELVHVLGSPGARRWILDVAEQALAHMPAGAVRITCSSEITEPLEQALAGRDGIEIRPDPELPPGFRARPLNGALVVDVTLTKLMDLQRPQLAIEVLRRLDVGVAD